MGHRGKSLITIPALLLLEATSQKMRFVVLKKSIEASLNLMDHLHVMGQIPGGGETIMSRREAIRCTMMANRKRRRQLIRGRGHIRRRNIGGSI
jgi:hypothetical protein